MNFQTKVYVGNLPENCSLEDFRSLFEKHGKVVECDIVKNYGFVHFADGEDAKSAVDALNDTIWGGLTLKVELSYSKVRHKPGMGNKSVCYRCGKSGHWSKDCPKGPSRTPLLNNNNDHSNKSENRGQFMRGNRGPYMNGGSSGSSGSFLQSGLLGGPNGYRNDSFRGSYREPLLSSSLYYERNSNAYSGNNSSGRRNNNNNNNTYTSLSRDLDREHSRNDPYYDSYPPPPPPPTRYRPYPSAYERRAPLPPLPGSSESLIPSLLSSLSSLSQYHHNNNSHNNSSHQHNNNNNNNNSSLHDLDPYTRPPPEYYERRQELLHRMPNRRGDWGE